MNNSVFLSDITSSESILARYSDICRIMSIKGYTSDQIHNLIIICCNLKNEKVRNRHLTIMNKFELINHKFVNGKHIYSLDSKGKTLKYLELKQRSNKRQLFYEEKIIFINILFTILKKQFSLFLNNIEENQHKNKDEIIVEYFKNANINQIWINNKFDNKYKEWMEENIVNRSFKNIYRCMEMWLSDLNLINKNKLTSLGIKLKNTLVNNNFNIEDVILLLNRKLEYLNINNENDYIILKNKFTHYYNKIKEPTGFADLPALFNLINLELAIKHNKCIKFDSKDIILNMLWKDGLITSLSNDDKGQLRYVVLQA